MATKQANALSLMNEWLTKVRSSKKQAADTSAGGDNSEPTTHPVMDADPQTKPTTEGARSSENSSDVKKELGSLGNTGQEDAPAKSDGKDPVDNMGTKSQAADEMKGNVEQPKKDKDMPDESPNHPSSTEKSSSLHARGAALLKKIASAKQVEESPKPSAPLVPPVEEKKEGKKKGEKKAEEETKTAAEKTAAEQFPEDAENGYIAAALLAQQLGLVKSAESNEMDTLIDSSVETLTKQAYDDATAAIEYVNAYNTGLTLGKLQKTAAMGGEVDPAALAAAQGGAPEGGAGGGIPPELMAMIQGGGGEGGAPPAGPEAGPPGGGAGGEAELNDIVEMLAQEGITPEELVAALGSAEGGEGGEAGGMEAAAPAGAPAAAEAKSEGESPVQEASENKENAEDEGKEEKKEASLRKVAEKLNRVMLRRVVLGR